MLKSLRASNLPVIEAVYLEGTDATERIDAEEWIRVERQADAWQLVVKQPLRRLTIYRLTGQCVASWQEVPVGTIRLLPASDTHFIVWIETDQGPTALKW